MSCRTHKLVNALSFLPSAAERKWKRPLLALGALFVIGLGGALSLGSQNVEEGMIGFIMVLLLGLITIAFGLLALIVSMFGCSICVARIMGRWSF